MSQWDKDYNQYIKDYTPATNKKIEERTAGLNQIVDNATNQAVGKVQTEIDKLPTAYQSAYDVNAIQQKINEREVAERMANLGLTNSGLNRTQQTAINIQRSNADAAITQQKNAVTASLKQQIADLYASGENQKAQNKLNVYNTYMDERDSNAVAYANNQASNRAAIQKAQIEAETEAKKITKEFDIGDYNRAAAWYENAPNPTEGIRKLMSYLNVLKGTKGYTDYQCQLVFNYITSERGNKKWSDEQIESAMAANGIVK